VGHKLFMENFFSADNYLLTNNISSCDIPDQIKRNVYGFWKETANETR
jgi:hypothetical protein